MEDPLDVTNPALQPNTVSDTEIPAWNSTSASLHTVWERGDWFKIHFEYVNLSFKMNSRSPINSLQKPTAQQETPIKYSSG